MSALAFGELGPDFSASGYEELGTGEGSVVGLSKSDLDGEGSGALEESITGSEGTGSSTEPEGSSGEESEGCADTETSGMELRSGLGSACVEGPSKREEIGAGGVA